MAIHFTQRYEKLLSLDDAKVMGSQNINRNLQFFHNSILHHQSTIRHSGKFLIMSNYNKAMPELVSELKK